MEGKNPIGSSSPPKKGCIHTNSFFHHDLRWISMKFVSLLASQNRIRPKTPVHFRPLLLPVGICHHSVGCLWSIGWMTFRILGSWWSSFTSINDGSCRTWTHSQPCIEVNVCFFQKKITSSNIFRWVKLPKENVITSSHTKWFKTLDSLAATTQPVLVRMFWHLPGVSTRWPPLKTC